MHKHTKKYTQLYVQKIYTNEHKYICQYINCTRPPTSSHTLPLLTDNIHKYTHIYTNIPKYTGSFRKNVKSKTVVKISIFTKVEFS